MPKGIIIAVIIGAAATAAAASLILLPNLFQRKSTIILNDFSLVQLAS
ncbi:MAG: hypothetical protein ACPL4E_09120 [Thermoproteota archaeon]